jgi:oligo-1,6-glucosidase/alpha-glucosidase
VANPTDWWKETTVYQVYPRSFQDSNGDGIGDLDGILARLDYLADLGIETIWLSPFYGSPQRDFGYDISDYRNVAPEYGNLESCDRLISQAHARGLKVVFDMVLNHTSDQHPWFQASRSSRDDPRRNWYVWRDGKGRCGRRPPNNWHAMIGGSGWHRDASTGQWYWAQFLPFQPDLNYRNPEVRAEMLDTLRFWLDRGVDGFRLDIVNALFEDAGFRNNPFAWKLLPSDHDPSMLFQSSSNTLNHPDTLAFMKELRRCVDAYDRPPRFLVGEVNASIEQARAHCGDIAPSASTDGLNLVFLFRSLGVPLLAPKMRALMEDYERHFPDPLLPTWVFSNHDRLRRISRLDSDTARAKLNAAWQLTARGVPFIYYGEEIGMLQQRLPLAGALDPIPHRFRLPQLAADFVRNVLHESINRDESRTPMQWDPSPNAGFCPDGISPWLPVPTDLDGRTVQQQTTNPDSLLSCYRRFLRLRREHPALRRGSFELLPEPVTGRDVVGYRRSVPEETLLVLLNVSKSPTPVPAVVPPGALIASTSGTRRLEARREPPPPLAPWECVVLSVS